MWHQTKTFETSSTFIYMSFWHWVLVINLARFVLWRCKSQLWRLWEDTSIIHTGESRPTSQSRVCLESRSNKASDYHIQQRPEFFSQKEKKARKGCTIYWYFLKCVFSFWVFCFVLFCIIGFRKKIKKQDAQRWCYCYDSCKILSSLSIVVAD